MCETCGDITSGFHNYSREYFDPTCTGDGYYIDTCTDCGYTKKTVTSQKLNHYGGEATCKALAVCERCGEGYGEIGDHVGGEATCTEQAICDVCGEDYGELKRHESDLDDSDCTTPVRCSVCGAVAKEANATHTWGEDNFCSNENCQQTKGFTFTFTYGDEVLFVRNVHTGNFYTFEGFEERDGLTLVGWVANEDADEDGEPDFYPIGDYTYVDGDLSFNAVYKLMYTVRFITYDIWENKYTEFFNPIMGEANQSVSLYDDSSNYYKFLGWATEEGGEVVYEANEEITLTRNLILYGVIRPYRAILELGDGAVWNDENGDPITVLEGNYSGEWIEIRKFPTRIGYIFKGFMDQTEWLWEPWQDEDTGEWVVDFYFDRADLEMTAVWEECTEHTFVDGKCACGMMEAPAKFEIVQQPVSVTGTIGETVSVSVEATGEGLTYQWYLRNAGSKYFSLSSITTADYTVTMDKTRAGRDLYCIITDANGNTLKTDVVTMYGEPTEKLEITTQPEDAFAKLGERYCVTVEAKGDRITYQWFFRKVGATNWNISSVKDNTYDDVMIGSRHNREVYCVITDAWGNSVSSDVVTLTAVPEVELEIIQQPGNASAKLGEGYCVTILAQGDNLRYTWYWRTKGNTNWNKSGVTDNTYDDEMTIARHNREVYCVVTDGMGNSVTSEIATITATPTVELEITKAPESQSVVLGANFNVVVEAQGEGLRYQWYYRKAGTESWTVSGQRDNTYDDVMTKARHNREVKCVITDMWGDQVETEIATITATPSEILAIVTEPTDAFAAMGENYCVTVEAVGDGLTYTWYFKNAGSSIWHTSGVKDNTYDDEMITSRAGREVYCVITDIWGNTVTTNTVTLVCLKDAEMAVVN